LVTGFSPRRFPSPLRYPGGKGKVVNYLKLAILENDLVGVDYVEPYAGGASVALSLLFEDFISHAYINDIDQGVHMFWKAVLDRGEELCERIAATPATMPEWHRQQDIQRRAREEQVDDLDVAFSTLFLNRTNRSGIISGGVIGGQDQSGTWGVDARYNREDLIRRIRKIGRFSSRITLSGVDAIHFLAQWQAPIRPTLAFLDPPYYSRGSDLYLNRYSHDDHVRVSDTVRELQSHWIVAYDRTPEIMTLYAEYLSVEYRLSYSAASRYRGAEVMFFGPSLALPSPRSPAHISVTVVDAARLAYLT
jgi:DNA adenine methylase